MGRLRCRASIQTQVLLEYPIVPLMLPAMAADRADESRGYAPPAVFSTTHWTVILEAGETQSPQSSEALEQLCRTYWYPLYAYARRQGHSPEDAQDLTQGFFARFLEKRYLKDVDRGKGKFRSFLLASLKHYLANEWDRTQAVKRGAEYRFISWDAPGVEERYLREPASELSAEKIYERRWALTVLENALQQLKSEYSSAGKGPLFETLEVYLTKGEGVESHDALGQKLGMAAGTVKVAIHRLRRRYGEVLRAQIAHTVAAISDIDEELRHLCEVLSQ